MLITLTTYLYRMSTERFSQRMKSTHFKWFKSYKIIWCLKFSKISKHFVAIMTLKTHSKHITKEVVSRIYAFYVICFSWIKFTRVKNDFNLILLTVSKSIFRVILDWNANLVLLMTAIGAWQWKFFLQAAKVFFHFLVQLMSTFLLMIFHLVFRIRPCHHFRWRHSL